MIRYIKAHFKQIENFLSKISRFGIFIPLGNLFIVYFGRFLKPKSISAFANRRHTKIENKILSIVGHDVFNTDNPGQPDNHVKSNIWVLWLQGESNMPELVKVCLESIKQNAGDHTVVVLSDSNLDEYIQLPERITTLYQDGKISNAHYSDIIRMALLSRYGGIWIDATILLTSNLDGIISNTNLYTIKNKPKGNNVSDRRWTGFFIATEPMNPLPVIVDRIFMLYWEKENVLIDYFLIDYAIDLAYKYNATVKEQIDSITENNPQIYNLLPLLPQKYNANEFEALTKDTSVFKLSWKKYKSSDLQEQSSVYCYLKNIYLNNN